MNSILKLNVVMEWNGFFTLTNQETVTILFLFYSCYANNTNTMLPYLPYSKDASDQSL
jgi:hypothetical protein